MEIIYEIYVFLWLLTTPPITAEKLFIPGQCCVLQLLDSDSMGISVQFIGDVTHDRNLFCTPPPHFFVQLVNPVQSP